MHDPGLKATCFIWGQQETLLKPDPAPAYLPRAPSLCTSIAPSSLFGGQWGVTPASAQVPGIKPGWATHKVGSLTSVLSNLSSLSTHLFCFILGATPGTAKDLLLALSSKISTGRLVGMLRIKPSRPMKANTLLTVLSFWRFNYL